MIFYSSKLWKCCRLQEHVDLHIWSCGRIFIYFCVFWFSVECLLQQSQTLTLGNKGLSNTNPRHVNQRMASTISGSESLCLGRANATGINSCWVPLWQPNHENPLWDENPGPSHQAQMGVCFVFPHPAVTDVGYKSIPQLQLKSD